MSTRPGPLPPKEWPAEMRDALSVMRSPRSDTPPPRDGSRSKGLEALGLFARHTDLAKAFLTFNAHVLADATITPRQRELLVLRVAHRRGSRYEWAQHVALAADAGITAEEVELVAAEPTAASWSTLELALLAAADELVDDARIADGTWQVLAGELDDRQLLDVVFTVGAYEVLAMAFRTFDIDPEE